MKTHSVCSFPKNRMSIDSKTILIIKITHYYEMCNGENPAKFNINLISVFYINIYKYLSNFFRMLNLLTHYYQHWTLLYSHG